MLDFGAKITIVWTNLGGVIELFQAKAALKMAQAREDFKHTWNVAIPAYLKWFKDNWQNLFVDVGNAAVTAISNAAQSIKDIVARLWDAIKNGMSGGFGNLSRDIGQILQRDLLDGFQATTAKLPEVVERAITPTEKKLQERLRKTAMGLARSFSTQYANIVNAGAAQGNVLGLNLPAIEELKKKQDAIAAGGINALAKVKSQETQNSAVESRLLTRGRASNPQEETNQLLKKLLDWLKENFKDSPSSESSDSLRVEVVT